MVVTSDPSSVLSRWGSVQDWEKRRNQRGRGFEQGQMFEDWEKVNE